MHYLGVSSINCGQVLGTECRQWPRNWERQGWVLWGQRSVGWVRGCVGMRGLFKFILEVSEYGIEDSVSGKDVIIMKVVVYGRLSMYVEVLVSRWMSFFWNCNTCMMSCMFPRVCECSSRCSAYLEVWLLFPRDSKWRYVNLNPSAPTIKGLIKLHKLDQLIRPVVNWRNAPAYKLSQLLTTKIRQFASLPYTFNIKNSTEIIRELKQTPVTSTSMFASLDITNMYSNIPIKETK